MCEGFFFLLILGKPQENFSVGFLCPSVIVKERGNGFLAFPPPDLNYRALPFQEGRVFLKPVSPPRLSIAFPSVLPFFTKDSFPPTSPLSKCLVCTVGVCSPTPLFEVPV